MSDGTFQISFIFYYLYNFKIYLKIELLIKEFLKVTKKKMM